MGVGGLYQECHDIKELKSPRLGYPGARGPSEAKSGRREWSVGLQIDRKLSYGRDKTASSRKKAWKLGLGPVL